MTLRPSVFRSQRGTAISVGWRPWRGLIALRFGTYRDWSGHSLGGLCWWLMPGRGD